MADRSWEWDLPDGQPLRVSVDRAGVESVWVGPRLVSRSGAGGRADGHHISLPPPPGGRASSLELKVAPSRTSCVARLDGQELRPVGTAGEEPIDEGRVLRARVGGVFMMVVGIVCMGYLKWLANSILAHEPNVTWSANFAMLGPFGFMFGLGTLVAPSRALMGYDETPDGLKIRGWVAITYFAFLFAVSMGVGITAVELFKDFAASHGYKHR